MERILLVEPDYPNKYPPIGLMKIATYHRNKGDYVEFYKGEAPYTIISRADRVYITSLFTFYFDVIAKTIRHYLSYKDNDSVYFGGIAATLMHDRFRQETKISKIITNQLFDSHLLGYDDSINIDSLPLDYSILDDTPYEYPAGDNFYAYATRGCPRKCDFCAVKTLEPDFIDTNNLIYQVERIRSAFGDKRHILLMDNNVLYSEKLESIAEDLQKLGFVKDEPNYVQPNQFVLLYNRIQKRNSYGSPTRGLQDKLIEYLVKFKKRIKNDMVLFELSGVIQEILTTEDLLGVLQAHFDFIYDIVEKYRSKKPLQRYVDFNQGIDARLLTKKKMECLSQLPLRPFRLAYDNMDSTNAYETACRIAYDYGVRHFSNYMLYNYNEKPEELWYRAYTSMNLYNSLTGAEAYSFPMRYAPIDRIDRHFVGKHWNKKFLSAMNVILNVTNGVVAKEEQFFLRAYGATPEEFIEILTMPNEFIKFRTLFEDNYFIQAWREEYHRLPTTARAELLSILSGNSEGYYSSDLQVILRFYKVTKHQVETGKTCLGDIINEQDSRLTTEQQTEFAK